MAHILEGSVRFADNLRITAQLVDAATGFYLWSGTFDRSSEDIFDIQDEIAGASCAGPRSAPRIDGAKL